MESELVHWAISPASVCFEITETAIISDLSYVAGLIAQLKSRGLRFALDDFGAGNSTFSYLKELDVDMLKIDGSFVAALEDNSVNQSFVGCMNDLAHVTGRSTVAEHVTTEATLLQLHRLGVDFAQGYHFAKPAPLAELANVMDRGKAPKTDKK